MNIEKHRLGKQQMTKEKAIEVYHSHIWKDWNDKDKIEFGLFNSCLCLPFREMKSALSRHLGRDVSKAMFAYADRLRQEYLGERGPPNFNIIMMELS